MIDESEDFIFNNILAAVCVAYGVLCAVQTLLVVWK